jgi:hypothetical protein
MLDVQAMPTTLSSVSHVPLTSARAWSAAFSIASPAAKAAFPLVRHRKMRPCRNPATDGRRIYVEHPRSPDCAKTK